MRNNSIAIVICSCGRPERLTQLLPVLERQCGPNDSIFVVVTRPEDAGIALERSFDSPTVHVVFSEKGLPKQRNVGLKTVAQTHDIVVFYDDDFIPGPDSICGIDRAFQTWPNIAGMTGEVIADGINGPGINFRSAKKLIENHRKKLGTERAPKIVKRNLVGLYGCNMAFRISAIQDTRFDERLPLYGWQEDIDFSARIKGTKVKTNAFFGVHLGTKSGRETSGVRLGYSQIVNPWYLFCKGSMPFRIMTKLTFRNYIANHIKLFKPEPWIDRRGRAAGNWIAVFDIVRRRANPENILTLKHRRT